MSEILVPFMTSQRAYLQDELCPSVSGSSHLLTFLISWEFTHMLGAVKLLLWFLMRETRSIAE